MNLKAVISSVLSEAAPFPGATHNHIVTLRDHKDGRVVARFNFGAVCAPSIEAQFRIAANRGQKLACDMGSQVDGTYHDAPRGDRPRAMYTEHGIRAGGQWHESPIMDHTFEPIGPVTEAAQEPTHIHTITMVYPDKPSAILNFGPMYAPGPAHREYAASLQSHNIAIQLGLQAFGPFKDRSRGAFYLCGGKDIVTNGDDDPQIELRHHFEPIEAKP